MTLDRFGPWKTGVIAFSIATLVFAKQIAFLLVEENRYFFLWTSRDAQALIANIVLLGTALWAMSLSLRKLNWPRLTRVCNHILVLVVAGSLLSLLPKAYLFPYEGAGRGPLAWLVIVAGVFFSLGFSRSRLVEWAAALCLIMSPLIVILAWQIVTMPTWSTLDESSGKPRPVSVAAPSSTESKPIFVFIFDEWSLKRTTAHGEFRTEFPNLRRLAETSCDFRNVHSFSTRSMHSLPAILCQIDQQLIVGSGQSYFNVDGKKTSTTDVPNLFKLAKTHGYFTALQGFYLPYRRILGDQLDYCRSGCAFPKGDGLVEEMAYSAVRNLQWLTDPVTDLKRRTIEARIQSQFWYDMGNRMFAESKELMQRCPPNTLACFHYPVPHGPFIFNPDGTYYGPYPQGSLLTGLRGTVADYERHLLLFDRIVGEIFDTLKRNNRYDDALLIFTSDHEWRSDPDEIDAAKSWKINPAFRRVPLLIKLPTQTTRRVIDQPVQNNQVLKGVIDNVLQGRLSEQQLLEGLKNKP